MSEFQRGWHSMPMTHSSPSRALSTSDDDYKFLQSLESDPDLLGSAEDTIRLTKALNAGRPSIPRSLGYFKSSTARTRNRIRSTSVSRVEPA